MALQRDSSGPLVQVKFKLWPKRDKNQKLLRQFSQRFLCRFAVTIFPRDDSKLLLHFLVGDRAEGSKCAWKAMHPLFSTSSSHSRRIHESKASDWAILRRPATIPDSNSYRCKLE